MSSARDTAPAPRPARRRGRRIAARMVAAGLLWIALAGALAADGHLPTGRTRRATQFRPSPRRVSGHRDRRRWNNAYGWYNPAGNHGWMADFDVMDGGRLVAVHRTGFRPSAALALAASTITTFAVTERRAITFRIYDAMTSDNLGSLLLSLRRIPLDPFEGLSIARIITRIGGAFAADPTLMQDAIRLFQSTAGAFDKMHAFLSGLAQRTPGSSRGGGVPINIGLSLLDAGFARDLMTFFQQYGGSRQEFGRALSSETRRQLHHIYNTTPYSNAAIPAQSQRRDQGRPRRRQGPRTRTSRRIRISFRSSAGWSICWPSSSSPSRCARSASPGSTSTRPGWLAGSSRPG